MSAESKEVIYVGTCDRCKAEIVQTTIPIIPHKDIWVNCLLCGQAMVNLFRKETPCPQEK